MKKARCSWLVFLLVAALLVGCDGNITTVGPATEGSTTEQTTATTENADQTPQTDATQGGTLPLAQTDPVFAQPVEAYYTAHSTQELANVGYGYVDLDQDGQNELVIGATAAAEDALSVFEIWTNKSGESSLVAKSDAQNRYYLQYIQEDMMWCVVKEVDGNATYYLMFSEGELSVSQGILCVDAANGEKQWYMTYDLDGDISNDDPVDAETATAILEMNRKFYTAVDYNLYVIIR